MYEKNYELNDLIAKIYIIMFTCFMLKLKIRDLLQLVNENNCIIKVVRNPGNFTEYSIETINEFVDIYGINPNQITWL